MSPSVQSTWPTLLIFYLEEEGHTIAVSHSGAYLLAPTESAPEGGELSKQIQVGQPRFDLTDLVLGILSGRQTRIGSKTKPNCWWSEAGDLLANQTISRPELPPSIRRGQVRSFSGER